MSGRAPGSGKPGGAGSTPAGATNKRGRPRIGEKRHKPWEALGMSERTYYRRMAEKNEPARGKGDNNG
jgi:hypothetical protein